MKLLLDEMWSPVIARQLRLRGHDGQAVAELPDLRGRPDEAIFAAAQAEKRAIVTENVVDYRALAALVIHRGDLHCGLIFTLNRTYPRGDNRTVGRIVRALDELLSSKLDAENLEFWLS